LDFGADEAPLLQDASIVSPGVALTHPSAATVRPIRLKVEDSTVSDFWLSVIEPALQFQYLTVYLTSICSPTL
jgi:hypothetical protein